MFTQSSHRQAAAVSFKFKLTGQNNSAALGFHGQEFFLLSGVYVCVCVCVFVCICVCAVCSIASDGANIHTEASNGPTWLAMGTRVMAFF